MSERGQVLELKDDLALIRMSRTEACSKCGVCANGKTEFEMLVEAKNFCAADVGDWVEVDLQAQDFLKAVGIMYGIPLIVLIFGFVLGYIGFSYTVYQSYNEIIGFSLGIAFMILSYIWIKQKEPYWKEQNFSPIAVKKINMCNQEYI